MSVVIVSRQRTVPYRRSDNECASNRCAKADDRHTGQQARSWRDVDRLIQRTVNGKASTQRGTSP